MFHLKPNPKSISQVEDGNKYELTNEKEDTLIEVPGGTLGPASLGLELVDGGGEDTLGTIGLSTVGFFFSLDNSLILLVLIS